ncbi:homodimeric glycerol 3-phosphate dehydrogenase (quinone) [Enhydrobacter aerosaccus]|uniref:Homodimeric glycerol 3-phosphate dehydrogenase (Quinone) n=1 Tax=Enhydrobacter aerosaccus TaxID=225324 RepID=A0A1T4JKQ0_9HYPH|nr:glycerol-3-phosphate dehydrogenase [Enhydrobacter aerosaccus]SJZ30637.1 homodimeric glycerol 3-phosphate dehydrogenase (quinone) [Enhydrobacter aerosaccus]
MSAEFDLAIVGGGVNGCGIAREAARRGLSVFLCEQDDLASGTSSASTKLIHGGLRYLEHYEFRLVREALREREVLWRMAPHIVRPLRFVLPLHSGLRPGWMLRLGLFLYDHLGGRALLPATETLNLTRDVSGAALKPSFTRAFEYSDCWVDDARLVVLIALDAARHGAVVRTRTRCVSAERGPGGWRVVVEDRHSRARSDIRARTLINAAGPWVGSILAGTLPSEAPVKVRLVQGSHIVVRRLFDHDKCYILQNADGRIVFAIPFERDFTLIGTTDRDYVGDLAAVAASGAEIDYLCSVASMYFRQAVTQADVVWTYSGVRPLYDDGVSEAQAVTRDYVLALDAPSGSAALLNIIGGKITTFRRLAEAALDKLASALPAGGESAETGTLPGGDFPVNGLGELAADLRRRYSYLAVDHAERLARAYGTRAATLLEDTHGLPDLGRRFGADLTEREVAFLMDHEWAETAGDVVWRRSKLGLRLTAAETAELDNWMTARRAALAGGRSARLAS